jgi:hypothetical protein
MANNQVQLLRYERKMQVLWSAMIPEFGCGSQQRLWKLVQVHIQVSNVYPGVLQITTGRNVLTLQATARDYQEQGLHHWRFDSPKSMLTCEGLMVAPYQNKYLRLPHWLIRETDIE